MKPTFMVVNLVSYYDENEQLRLKATDRFTGKEIKTGQIQNTRELEGYLVHETTDSIIIEEKRHAQNRS